MRILLTGPFPYRSIPERFENMFFLDSLIQEIVNRGDKLILLTSAPDIPKDIEIHKNNVSLYVCKIGKHGNLRAGLSFVPEIKKLVSVIRRVDTEKQLDIMHAHWCYTYAAACLKIDKNRTLVTLHDWPDVVCPMFHNYYWNKRQILGNEVIREAHNFTAVSEYIADLFHQTKKKEIISIIPNGIFLENTSNKQQRYSISREFTILAVNNGFGERKNVTTTIRAFIMLQKKYPDIHLTLCGSDYEKHGLAEKWCRDHKIETANIEFVGYVSPRELQEYYRNATVFVHVSKEESFGMILLESMKNGCPIVAGKNSGAVPWVLENGKSGLLVDVDSVEEVATGIEKMMDETLREQYIESGYRRVTDFDERKVLPMYMELYESICQKAK